MHTTEISNVYYVLRILIELVEIVRKIAIERGVKNSDLHLINDSAKNCKSGKEFETAIRNNTCKTLN